MVYKIREKNNPLAVHAYCDTLESAQDWIDTKAPEYCAKGYFSDKTLTPASFEIESPRPVVALRTVLASSGTEAGIRHCIAVFWACDDDDIRVEGNAVYLRGRHMVNVCVTKKGGRLLFGALV